MSENLSAKTLCELAKKQNSKDEIRQIYKNAMQVAKDKLYFKMIAIEILENLGDSEFAKTAKTECKRRKEAGTLYKESNESHDAIEYFLDKFNKLNFLDCGFFKKIIYLFFNFGIANG